MKRIACYSLMLVLVITSCKRKAFVEHKIKLEKLEAGCDALKTDFRMNSNFGGERYEFQKCLPGEYSGKQVSSERHGDTIVVKFAATDAPGKMVYQVTLDIDAYPLYSFLSIDGDTYTIAPADK